MNFSTFLPKNLCLLLDQAKRYPITKFAYTSINGSRKLGWQSKSLKILARLSSYSQHFLLAVVINDWSFLLPRLKNHESGSLLSRIFSIWSLRPYRGEDTFPAEHNQIKREQFECSLQKLSAKLKNAIKYTISFKLDLCATKIFIAYPYNRFEHTIGLWTVMFRRLLQSLLNGAIYIRWGRLEPLDISYAKWLFQISIWRSWWCSGSSWS